MPGFLSPRKGVPLLLIPESSGINKGQRVPDRSKTAHRKPLVKCFLTENIIFIEVVCSVFRSSLGIEIWNYFFLSPLLLPGLTFPGLTQVRCPRCGNACPRIGVRTRLVWACPQTEHPFLLQPADKLPRNSHPGVQLMPHLNPGISHPTVYAPKVWTLDSEDCLTRITSRQITCLQEIKPMF